MKSEVPNKPPSSGIKSWAPEDRPREKLLLKGKESLSDSELLAILIRGGTRKLTALDIARQLLQRVQNDLDQLAKLSVQDLEALNVPGLARTKAITLVAAMELGRRRRSGKPPKRTAITCSRDAYDEFYPLLADKPHEEFWILLLNRRHQVIERTQLSKGGWTGTVVDVRQLFELAIKAKATAIILGHNHPSGNTTPSAEDRALTARVAEAGKTLDIKVLDHLIVAGQHYVSFADEGLMPTP